jgi:hypothetical protein
MSAHEHTFSDGEFCDTCGMTDVNCELQDQEKRIEEQSKLITSQGIEIMEHLDRISALEAEVTRLRDVIRDDNEREKGHIQVQWDLQAEINKLKAAYEVGK